MNIRPATPADYPAVAAVLSAATPRRPVSAEALSESERRTRTHPKGLHLAQWVALDESAPDGPEAVGFAGVAQWAGSFHPDRYHALLAVTPDRQGRGVGRALAETVRAHLEARGAREVLAGAYEDDPRGLPFLLRQGFAEVAREFDNVLALADFRPQDWAAQAALPPGYRRLTLEDFVAGVGEDAALEATRACFNGARADEPRFVPAQPYTADEFREYARHPSALPGGLQLAVTDRGEVAALSELWRDLADPTRLDTGLTGTARAHRRRGLALALKLAALDVARAVPGVQEVWTQNATTNRPMLALNERLGFAPQPAYVECRWGGLEMETA